MKYCKHCGAQSGAKNYCSKKCAEYHEAYLKVKVSAENGLSTGERRALIDERHARIIRFSSINRRRRKWIALMWVVDELSTRQPDGTKAATHDEEKVREAAAQVLRALGDGAFSQSLLPTLKQRERVLFLSESEPFRFISRDEAKTFSRMTTAGTRKHGPLRWALEVIRNLWVPSGLLAELFRVREWHLPDWLEQSTKAAKPVAKSRGGAKPQYDWPDAEQKAAQLWQQNGGDFRDWDIGSGWQSQADLERLIIEYLSTGDKGPAESTVRPRVSRWCDKMRQGQ